MEPDGLSQIAHGLQAKESVALHAPAALFAQQSSQNVGDGIEVGGKVQAPPLQIVTSIDDDGEILGRNDLAEAIDKLGAARPAGEYDNHAAFVLPAKPSRSAAARIFSESKPGRAVTVVRNSG